jgi:hypothetical protein
MRTTLRNRILAIQTTASGRIAASPGFEAVTIESNTFRLRTGAAHWIFMKRTNLECGAAKQIKLIETPRHLAGVYLNG